MIEKVLVLGNGFNRALKLGVDYSDYFSAKNSKWKYIKAHYKDSELIKYLKVNVLAKNYNIEGILEKYLDIASCSFAQKDKKAFTALEQSFSRFVDETINNKKREDFDFYEKAFCVMSRYQKMRKCDSPQNAIFIYSFSYVRYEDIRNKLTISTYDDIEQGAKDNYLGNPWGGNTLDIAYNHGMSSKGKSYAIFGISSSAFRGKHVSLINSYKFLIKEYHANYPIEDKCYLINSLFEATTIEFFGFGFTSPDVPYVKEWLTTPPVFKGKREIIINDRKENQGNIIKAIKEIAGHNWKIFRTHYNIKLRFHDNTEKAL